VAAGGDPDKEAQENRLADVRGIEETTQLRIAQPKTNGAPEGGLVAAHQLGRRLLIAGAHPIQQGSQGPFVRHGPPHRGAPRGYIAEQPLRGTFFSPLEVTGVCSPDGRPVSTASCVEWVVPGKKCGGASGRPCFPVKPRERRGQPLSQPA